MTTEFKFDSGLDWIAADALGLPPDAIPSWAAQRRAQAAATGDDRTVCVQSAPGESRWPRIWLDSAHARGWLLPQGDTADHLQAEAFGSTFAAAQVQGFTGADAAILACLPTPVGGQLPAGAALPRLSWGEAASFAPARAAASSAQTLGVYGLADSADRLAQVLDAGLRTVQLRIKTPANPDAAWHAWLHGEARRSIALARAAGALLFINDHWQLAAGLGADAVHLGQEDLLALGDAGRARLQATGMALGVSSHSLWELCRAHALAPRYIACGPVWPTVTKDMPWVPQGMDNLAWWCAMAQTPVVAIGGILQAQQVREAARAGADGVCLVRGLGDQPRALVPTVQAAFNEGHALSPRGVPVGWPHPMLPASA